jgi:thioesterase domain-containing protein
MKQSKQNLTQVEMKQLAEQLESFVETHLPLGRAMGIRVSHYNRESLSLSAPLELNDNDKSTAFGGSLYCAAVMSCWSLLYLECLARKKPNLAEPNIVIGKAEIEYLAPVHSEHIVASCTAPTSQDWEAFFDSYDERGRAKISLCSSVHCSKQKAVQFSGRYAVIGSF